MDSMKQLLLLSEKLYSFLENEPEDKEDKRDEYISYVNKLLDARGQTIDQLKVMDNAIKSYPDFIDAGLEKAKMLNLISANDFRDIVFSLHKEAAEPITHSTGSDSKYSHMKAVERDTGLYLKVLGGMKP